MKNTLFVEIYGDPDVKTRAVLPDDDENTVKDKNRWPFMAQKSALIKVEWNKTVFYIANETNFKYDGATIPFKIGKGNMKLLIPALFHDIMCENKDKIGFNRYLSSLVFRDLLIKCKVNKITAQIMFLAVDNYQRFQRGWK